MLNMAQNPNLALQEACKNNPDLNNVLEMCKGKDPKAVFYEECQRRGIEPDYIINLLQ